ncbi:MAG: hypothetical protein UY48_C0008G0011 [Candidatus Gottesmanbacteria bacterium GW2011_GWB1_49_7]|uniref:Uncharacterized protein n=1 Tax=Candidatus Gottesmanbacteria bacterium GW2011_GWB1_49_7 TaxID=1618448 RepID=A0A0G1W261_9BACT|nr:MAG: hypothetical protein UY48_C0008G0011 [Candidatus Gottesmanbacteria bacterium GW2011_GWB1_49_7]
MRTTQYIIYRKGQSNSFNSLGAIGTVTAPKEADAVAIAEYRFDCYNGQYLEARPWSHCGVRDQETALKGNDLLMVAIDQDIGRLRELDNGSLARQEVKNLAAKIASKVAYLAELVTEYRR